MKKKGGGLCVHPLLLVYAAVKEWVLLLVIGFQSLDHLRLAHALGDLDSTGPALLLQVLGGPVSVVLTVVLVLIVLIVLRVLDVYKRQCHTSNSKSL